jgi:cyclase
MLKKRIIPKFLIKEGRLVKAVQFHNRFREAGNPLTTAKVYNSYGVDEIIFLDIEASLKTKTIVKNLIEKISEEIFMPFTVGGGIKNLTDINNLLRAGADKVAVTTSAIENPEFVNEAAKQFGSQCITVGIDYRREVNGEYRVYSHGGTVKTNLNPVEWAQHMEDKGCGEILFTSIDRDGTMSGYDIEMIEKISSLLKIPVMASSGAGSLKDCVNVLNSGASAAVISSMFLFTDHSPIKVRSYLFSNHVNVRASKNSRN